MGGKKKISMRKVKPKPVTGPSRHLSQSRGLGPVGRSAASQEGSQFYTEMTWSRTRALLGPQSRWQQNLEKKLAKLLAIKKEDLQLKVTEAGLGRSIW